MKLTIETKRYLVKAAAIFFVIAILCGVVAGPFARAGTTPTMDVANREFAEGRYAQAASDFEQIGATSGYSAPLFFDLGNAYLREDQPLRAVLAYERAQILAPRDEAIATNLAVARTRANVVDDRNIAWRIARKISMNGWAELATGAFWIGVTAAGAMALSKRRDGLLVTAVALSAIAFTTSVAALTIESPDLHRALVMQPTPVLVSPFESAQSDFALNPGSTVDVGRARDGYVFVHDKNGRSGWVERAQVETLLPSAT
ncbi:MAG: hypothetical protein ABI183_01260 [Polyangiaceae bacterium]